MAVHRAAPDVGPLAFGQPVASKGHGGRRRKRAWEIDAHGGVGGETGIDVVVHAQAVAAVAAVVGGQFHELAAGRDEENVEIVDPGVGDAVQADGSQHVGAEHIGYHAIDIDVGEAGHIHRVND